MLWNAAPVPSATFGRWPSEVQFVRRRARLAVKSWRGGLWAPCPDREATPERGRARQGLPSLPAGQACAVLASASRPCFTGHWRVDSSYDAASEFGGEAA